MTSILVALLMVESICPKSSLPDLKKCMPALKKSAEPKKPSDSQLEAAFKGIGHEDWAVRERASRALTEYGYYATSGLLDRCHDKNLEVRRRVRQILSETGYGFYYDECPRLSILEMLGKDSGELYCKALSYYYGYEVTPESLMTDYEYCHWEPHYWYVEEADHLAGKMFLMRLAAEGYSQKSILKYIKFGKEDTADRHKYVFSRVEE